MKFLYYSKIQKSRVATPAPPAQDPLREPSRWARPSLLALLVNFTIALLIFLASVIGVLALSSCTRHHYSIIENKSVSIDSSATKTTDTLKIYIRDSISQKQVRDTLYIEKFRIIYRDRTTRDTIFKHQRDTIFVSPQDIENHTKIIAKSSSKIQVHKIAFWFILIVFLILILKIYFKKF